MDNIRVIPCLDMKEGRVVKGVHFVELRDAGDPVEAAEAYAADGADEIAFLDITATVEKRQTMFDTLKKVTGAVDVPVTVGGGIKSLEDVQKAFASGANCVSVSSAAYRDPEFIKRAVNEYGSEKVLVAIDADTNEQMPSNRELWIDGGRTATDQDAIEFAKKMADLGVGQLLPTSKATDGTKDGYDIELTRAIADATDLPVIASGGAGKLDHFYEAVVEGHAQAVLAASVFHFGEFTVSQVKEYLDDRGLPVGL